VAIAFGASLGHPGIAGLARRRKVPLGVFGFAVGIVIAFLAVGKRADPSLWQGEFVFGRSHCLDCVELCCLVLYVVLCCVVLFWYCIVLYCIVLCCLVLYCIKNKGSKHCCIRCNVLTSLASLKATLSLRQISRCVLLNFLSIRLLSVTNTKYEVTLLNYSTRPCRIGCNCSTSMYWFLVLSFPARVGYVR